MIGSGGRGHALCRAVATRPVLSALYRAPGIVAVAASVPIGATTIDALVAFNRANATDLVVPGPEAPLAAGLTDTMEAAGIPCYGPTAAAADLVRHRGAPIVVKAEGLAAGGRVLNVRVTGPDLPAARARTYAAIEWVKGSCRQDIGARAVGA